MPLLWQNRAHSWKLVFVTFIASKLASISSQKWHVDKVGSERTHCMWRMEREFIYMKIQENMSSGKVIQKNYLTKCNKLEIFVSRQNKKRKKMIWNVHFRNESMCMCGQNEWNNMTRKTLVYVSHQSKMQSQNCNGQRGMALQHWQKPPKIRFRIWVEKRIE